MELKKHKLKDKIKWIVTAILIGILSIGLFGLGLKVMSNETTKTYQGSMFTYEIGTLDSEGAFVKDTSTTITKDFIKTDGLTIELQKNATVTYDVHFFTEDKEFISSVSDLSADFDGTIPDGAEFVKISVTPVNDAEVDLFEINGYVKQLTITVNK